MDALVTDGIMKPDVRERLQKISGLDAIIVGEVSCSVRKDQYNFSYDGYNIPMGTLSATVAINMRVYAVKTGDCILSKLVTRNKSEGGWSPGDQGKVLMPLMNECVDLLGRELLGGEVTRKARFFADGEELKATIEQVQKAGVTPLKIADKLEAYAKAHPESAPAVYNMAVLAYMKGNKEEAFKLFEEALLKPKADVNALRDAYKELSTNYTKREN